MGRLRALVAKELREHLWAGLALAMVLGGALLLLLVSGLLARRSVSLLQSYTFYLWVFVPLAGVVLGNRLVVHEYYGRTQLFLEALPVRRPELLAVKCALGLAALSAVALGALATFALFASQSEPIDARFLAILVTRSLGWVACLWSYLFAMGLLGKLRIPLYLTTGLAAGLLVGLTDVDLSRFGPFALIDFETLPGERTHFPVDALLEALAATGVCLGIALVLGLIHEGSVAEVLARPMSQREKALSGMVILGLIVGVAVLDERRHKAPLEFDEDDLVVASEEAPLEVLYLHEEAEDDADALLAVLEADVAALEELLGRPIDAVLRVALHEQLDGRTFEQAYLEENDGVLLRANFRRGAEWDERGFRAFALARVLREATGERAGFEPQAWVLDGFARWWTERDEAREPEQDRALLRAAWATRAAPLAEADLVRWFRTRERLGLPVAEGLAASGLWALERRRGRAAVEALARALYGREVPEDASETLRTWRTPFPAVFEQAAGLPLTEHLAAWNAELEALRARPAVADLLARVPEGSGAFEVRAGQGTIRHLEYALRFARPPGAGTPCALLHLELSPFDHELDPRALRRQEHLWAEGAAEAQHRLTRYGQGTRVFVALEVESEALGCPLRLAAERRVIE